MIDNQDGQGEIDELRSCQAPVARTARFCGNCAQPSLSAASRRKLIPADSSLGRPSDRDSSNEENRAHSLICLAEGRKGIPIGSQDEPNRRREEKNPT